jgi:superfamily II DNA or RNA helicase/HKD family nuclease
METVDYQVKFLTNKSHQSFYHELKESLSTCSRFYFSVAFIHNSAMSILSKELKTFNDCNKNGKIITTNYMNGTDPEALETLLKYKNIETKIYETGIRAHNNGFHTKGYLFDMGDTIKIYIGSSNLSQSALKTNQEWNLSVISKTDSLFKEIKEEFDLLWNESIPLTPPYIESYRKEYFKKYNSYDKELFNQILAFMKQSEGYHFLKGLSDFTNIDKEELKKKLSITHISTPKPNLMQEQAIDRLQTLRSQGETKALVIAATGTGKTFLAAFDAFQVDPKRVLFVVHREKILKEALRTFKLIHPNKKMGLLTGNIKDFDQDYIFATNTMMSKKEILDHYDKEAFDYIVIDEAHRSAANTYQKIINHFNPKFLLGMTATPERTDALSIFKLYDHNIAVEIRLREALDFNLVVPFHYFGINDLKTDLSSVKLTDIDKLAEKLNVKARVDLITESIEDYVVSGKKRKALGFCVNIKHAKYMADEFNNRGYISTFLSGENNNSERDRAIERLEDDNDPLSYIFTIDIFNEGIDIPSLNLVLMLRPTESPIIFTQQLGRGLRHYSNKEYLIVLDFIGNHNKTFLLPIALAGDKSYDKEDLILMTKRDFFDIPGDTFIRLDEISKQRILEQLESVNFNEIKYLKEAYQEVKLNMIIEENKLYDYPMITQFSLDGIDPVRMIKKKGSFLKFVSDIEDDSELDNIVQNVEQYSYIKFFDNQLPIKRVYEFAIIRTLIDNISMTTDGLFSHMKKYIESPSLDDFKHAISYLDHKFFSSTETKKFGKPILIEHNSISLRNSLKKYLKNKIFKDFIDHTIDYGLLRYMDEYGYHNFGYPFLKLYQTYDKIDIPHLARFDKSFQGMIMSGLIKIENNFYLFVNLNKIAVKESIDYADHFESRSVFQWESPNSTSQASPVGIDLINHNERNIKIHLLVRKFASNESINKGYSNELTYLGTMNVIKYEHNKPIRFLFKLDNIIPEALYIKLTEVIE